jgi:hypothetical protein
MKLYVWLFVHKFNIHNNYTDNIDVREYTQYALVIIGVKLVACSFSNIAATR